ncbi:MAG: DEAD/DEAH box helicase, partial [Blastomonas fulva]
MIFADLGLSEKLIQAVTDSGYTTPTAIQAQAIPSVLMGKDIIGIAQTGTGKTAAFVLPMIDVLGEGRSRARMPRSLILEPTRELAAQVAENFDKYGKYHKLSMALLIGGVSMGDQIKALEKGVDVLIATPGRLMDLYDRGNILLTGCGLLVIDEAGMLGTRQMERVVSHAQQQGAKVVMVGDPQQLQAIEAGAAFRAAAERHGAVEIASIRRQQIDWQREATRELATGRTGEALGRYERAGNVHVAETREAARADLVDAWDRDRQAKQDASRIILTHTNDEVRAINEAVREKVRASGDLGEDVALKVERGARHFADGDRIMFLKNERSLSVKNGSLGTVESVSALRMSVKLDDGKAVAFDLKDYAHLDHGYAATIHKAQGMTVDQVKLLATPGMDSHGAYVALSRHRTQVDLHYGKDDFADRKELVRTLSRERGK